ncbi:MAG: transglycosylase SLT domain-containing protein [Woeseiaceae bacterium]
MVTRLPIVNAFICLAFLLLSAAATADDSLLEQQRAAFRAVRADVERGNWQAVRPYESLLKTYALWPDLRALDLKARIGEADHGEIDAFLNEYGILKPARELRYRYALHLVDEGLLQEYLSIYQQFYQGLEIAKLDCLALQAEISAGHAHRVVSRALNLWKVGRSQAEECDLVFDHLLNRNLLTRQQYAQRFDLAIEAQQFGLARYLAKSLDATYRKKADEWQRAHSNPTALFDEYLDYADTALARKLFAYAVERIAYKDPMAAHRHWRMLSRHFSFNDEQTNRNLRHIALWAARTHRPEAAQMLSTLPEPVRDAETGRWLVRNHLLFRRWHYALAAIRMLPEEELNSSEWRYWEAVTLAQVDQGPAAERTLERLAEERDYYGFLAADSSGAPYSLTDAPLTRDASILPRLAEIPGFVRARELFHVGLESKGRSEWDAEMRMLSAAEQVQAALLADGWGWHSRAIATVAKAGEYDDLQVRYPLPWRSDFEQQATTAGIDSSWAYGIARSESLFMRDVRSSAGAIGLMQLMPATGRETARELRLPWSGQATLTNSASNIRLGTHYLGKMFTRFNENRVLATAAYNAGPARVEAWLPSSGTLDARIWIENIPFNETRAYVRRVLTDESIFHWRMTGQLRRISSELPLVAAAGIAGKTVNSD